MAFCAQGEFCRGPHTAIRKINAEDGILWQNPTQSSPLGWMRAKFRGLQHYLGAVIAALASVGEERVWCGRKKWERYELAALRQLGFRWRNSGLKIGGRLGRGGWVGWGICWRRKGPPLLQRFCRRGLCPPRRSQPKGGGPRP